MLYKLKQLQMFIYFDIYLLKGNTYEYFTSGGNTMGYESLEVNLRSQLRWPFLVEFGRVL